MKIQEKVGIVIINWNNYEDTSECLRSISGLTYSDLDVAVVDNGSTDDSLFKLETEFPEVNFIASGSNLGFARGNNLGIGECLSRGAEYILLLNDDVVCPPGFIEPLLECFKEDPNTGLVGPKIHYFDRPDTIWTAGGRILWRRGAFTGYGMNEIDRGQYDREREVDYVAGAVMMIPKAVLDKVGLMPECYFLGGEEVDFAVSIHRAGFKVLYTPRVSCLHKVGYSGNRDLPFVYNRFRNALLFMDHHLPRNLLKLWLAHQFFYLSVLKRTWGLMKGDPYLKTLPLLFHLAQIDHSRYDAVYPEHLEAVRETLKRKSIIQ